MAYKISFKKNWEYKTPNETLSKLVALAMRVYYGAAALVLIAAFIGSFLVFHTCLELIAPDNALWKIVCTTALLFSVWVYTFSFISDAILDCFLKVFSIATESHEEADENGERVLSVKESSKTYVVRLSDDGITYDTESIKTSNLK